jgi:tetrahydromethanopterin S-methyltransferase subunit A
VEAFGSHEAAEAELADVLAEARRAFLPMEYDCLGCPVCYPAVAANAFAEAYPEAAASLDLCPTEVPEERRGWPPLPGNYTVSRYGAPVAVCVLNSESLLARLAERGPTGLAITGTLHTENLGIERVIKNTLANPNIRFLLLCGEDTRQAVGHLPGQSFASLFSAGIDGRSRIVGANGKRPFLKNVSPDEVSGFLRQVQLVNMIGEEQVGPIVAAIEDCAERTPCPMSEGVGGHALECTVVSEPLRLSLDPAGYFVVYPDVREERLVLEHYTNQGILDAVLAGKSTGALYAAAIERNLVSRLDHAAYLGRELARAEQSLLVGTPFVQDAAPGQLVAEADRNTYTTGCGCNPAPKKKGCC